MINLKQDLILQSVVVDEIVDVETKNEAII